MIEEDKEYFFDDPDDIGRVIGAAKRSLHYLDNDTWVRELYKNALEGYGTYLDKEHIINITESIAKDLNDKKWEEEIYKDLLPKISDDEIKEIKKYL